MALNETNFTIILNVLKYNNKNFLCSLNSTVPRQSSKCIALLLFLSFLSCPHWKKQQSTRTPTQNWGNDCSARRRRLWGASLCASLPAPSLSLCAFLFRYTNISFWAEEPLLHRCCASVTKYWRRKIIQRFFFQTFSLNHFSLVLRQRNMSLIPSFEARGYSIAGQSVDFYVQWSFPFWGKTMHRIFPRRPNRCNQLELHIHRWVASCNRKSGAAFEGGLSNRKANSKHERVFPSTRI